MNTTFAVEIFETGELVKVAFRDNFGTMRWLNPLAVRLPYYTPVIPIGNSAQGIFTIGDIIKSIEEDKDDNK